MTHDATYEYFKRYRQTLTERTAKAYAEWERIRRGTTLRDRIAIAEGEFDKRERQELSDWLRHHGYLLQSLGIK